MLELRRRHSLGEVAEIAGLPLGTVKAIISRSGLFADNPRHRAMFTLPPRQSSRENLPTVPELPRQQVVTGDKESNVLLWLRQVVPINSNIVATSTNPVVIGYKHRTNKAISSLYQDLFVL